METETYAFSADINQLLSLIINTIYSNKEVFLREIISNSSDALNKIRYQSLTDSTCLDVDPNLEIKISFDHENKILSIMDTGIGMTKEELINNLGTIASSGTKKFIESLNATKDVNLIGQFGVGFYSAYLVANKVSVVSKNNGDDQYLWESGGNGSFSIVKDESDHKLNRGTKLMLHLKEDMYDYLEESKIRDLVKIHSNFIDFPIKVQTTKTREVEVETVKEEVETVKEEVETVKEEVETAKEELETVKEELETVKEEVETVETEESPKKETRTETYTEFEQLNKTKPIWTRNPKEITDDEYSDFYKSITGDYDNHLEHLHFSVEGQVDFKALLYIPKRVPYDLFDGQNKRKSDIKLYVKKVFITDDFEELVPEYLKFVRGVIETDDVPLNISRETLQQNKLMKIIGKNIVKKMLEMFTSVSNDSEKFRIFYEQYSKHIKLGVHEDTTNRVKLASLLRYETSKSDGDLISLDEYIENMKEGQNNMYYITSDSVKSIQGSPFLDYFKSKEYEVLYLVDPLDEYITQQLKDYKDKKLLCITKENIELNKNDSEKEEQERFNQEYKPVCDYFKSVLNDEVEKVVVSNRLANHPCLLSTSEFGWTANMQRIAKAQTFGKQDTMQYMMGKKTLEISPQHEIIKKMKNRLDSNSSADLKDLVRLLYDLSLQSSGFTIENASDFNKRVLNLINNDLTLFNTSNNLEEIVGN
jgi:molecular chaperone HtpG